MSEDPTTPPLAEAQAAGRPRPSPAARLPGHRAFGQRTVHTDRDRYLALMEALFQRRLRGMHRRQRRGLPDPSRAGTCRRVSSAERFEVVVELLSFSEKERLRVRCQVPADDPVVPSLFDLWPGSEAHERETFDMFGVRLQRPSRPHPHPDARGLGRSPAAQGLRPGHVPVQFKEAPK